MRLPSPSLTPVTGSLVTLRQRIHGAAAWPASFTSRCLGRGFMLPIHRASDATTTFCTLLVCF